MTGTFFAAAAFAFHGVASMAAVDRDLTVQYAAAYQGKVVQVRTDEGIRRTYAGKMMFHSEGGTWCSVCANIHKHIGGGDIVQMHLHSSKDVGGNIAKAGNIVARFFNEATSPEQCAGLQLAVWEALEDGGNTPDFQNGHFAAQSDAITMAYAMNYYAAVNTAADAVYFEPYTHTPVQAQLSTRF